MTRGTCDHLETGEWGERQAESLLRKQGYKILARRLRIGSRDEIDLVARRGDVLVFVETKTRAGESYGRPAAAVDRRKRHALSRAAVRYVASLRDSRICFRFDVVEVIGNPEEGARAIRHIENAFYLDSVYMLPA